MFKVNNKAIKTVVFDGFIKAVVFVALMLTLNIFHTFVLVFLLLTLRR